MPESSVWKNPWWVTFASVLAMMASSGVLVFTFSVFMIPLTREFGLGRSVITGGITLGNLVGAICAPIIGNLIDRYGLRVVMLPGIVLYSLAMAALSLNTGSVPLLISSIVLCQLTGSTCSPVPYSKAISLWFEENRGLALGIALTGVGLGTALVPQYATYLISHYGWRGGFVGMGIVTFVLMFPATAVFVREPPAIAGAAEARAARAALPGMTSKEAMGTGRFWAMLIAFFLMATAINGTVVHLVPMLSDRGLPIAVAAGALSVSGIAAIFGRILFGYLLDLVFASYVTVLSIIIAMLGILVFALGLSGSMIFVGAALLGLTIGSEYSFMGYLAARYFGLKRYGEIYGYINSALIIGIGFGPFVMGMSFDLVHSYTTTLYGFEMVLLVVAVLFAVLGPYAFPAVMTRKPVTPTPPQQKAA